MRHFGKIFGITLSGFIMLTSYNIDKKSFPMMCSANDITQKHIINTNTEQISFNQDNFVCHINNINTEKLVPDYETEISLQIKNASYEKNGQTLSDVCGDGINKTYMDYHLINTASTQYDIISKLMTTGVDGLLYTDDGYIGVALGSYFGELGSKWSFTLDSGTILNVIKVEEKADEHVKNGCMHNIDGSVIELVIDEPVAAQYWGRADNGYINSGNFNNISEFTGSIVSVKRID